MEDAIPPATALEHRLHPVTSFVILPLFALFSAGVAFSQGLAEGALSQSRASLAVSVTGVAGPGASEFKPEGRVCFGLARSGRDTRCETREFGPIGRAEVRAASVARALELLLGGTL